MKPRPTATEDRAAMATSAFDSLAYIRDYYGVPAQLNGRVLYTWQAANHLGTIVGTSGASLLVLMDGERDPIPFHPTWELRYLDQSTETEAQPSGQAAVTATGGDLR